MVFALAFAFYSVDRRDVLPDGLHQVRRARAPPTRTTCRSPPSCTAILPAVPRPSRLARLKDPYSDGRSAYRAKFQDRSSITSTSTPRGVRRRPSCSCSSGLRAAGSLIRSPTPSTASAGWSVRRPAPCVGAPPRVRDAGLDAVGRHGGIALTNVVPFILRRPAEYEVAISGAYFFEMSGCTSSPRLSSRPPVRPWRMAWGSLLLGLALLARPVDGRRPVSAARHRLLFRRRGDSRRRRARDSRTVRLCVVVLMVYNAIRFGGFGDFGTRYQLAGLDVKHLRSSSSPTSCPAPSAICSSPAQVSLVFPHVFLQTTAQYPFAVPRAMRGIPAMLGPEIAGGMLPTMPITPAPVVAGGVVAPALAGPRGAACGDHRRRVRRWPSWSCSPMPCRDNAAVRSRLRVAGAGFGVSVVGGDARAFAPAQLGEAVGGLPRSGAERDRDGNRRRGVVHGIREPAAAHPPCAVRLASEPHDAVRHCRHRADRSAGARRGVKSRRGGDTASRVPIHAVRRQWLLDRGRRHPP